MQAMVTADMIREVSRTGQSHVVLGYEVTAEYLIYHTVGADWYGCYISLKAKTARRIAHELNMWAPWESLRPQVEVLEGVLVPEDELLEITAAETS